MCGFVGFVGKTQNKKEIINKMMARIIHRGPDMGGSYIDEDVALGFRRLSIIDLSEIGNQPMLSEDKSIAVVFNGEIYNFMDLRKDLISKGHTFITKGDTEVLLHGYEEYGDGIVEKLRGMFSFVIYDKKNNSFFGARDFFGIKPFYYSILSCGDFVFGSEIKSFLEHPGFVKKVNKDALRPYLTFQYSSQDETFFDGVYKLPPAHCFTYKDGKMEIRRYWDVDFTHVEKTFDEYVDQINETIKESVQAHKISDVKIGAFLSGGVDSSYITTAMMPEESFSVGFAFDRFNETDEAAELSKILGIKNFKKIIDADECFEAFSDIQYHMDEPQSNPSSVPLYFLAKLAAEHVTVVLSGEGADEIFAGYEWYDDTPLMRKIKKLPAFFRKAAATITKKLPYFKGHDLIIRCSPDPEDYFIGQALVFSEKEANAILLDDYKRSPTVKDITSKIYARVKDKDELSKKQYLDINLWMPGDILLKADKMSMAHSLELRVPFLDRYVMKCAQEIPSRYKINARNTKYVMRQAANKTLPDEWANRKKMGFPVPIRYWLREEKYYNIVKKYFESDFAAEFFDTKALVSMLDDHKNEKVNNGRKIWTVFTFLTWYERFFILEK